MDTNEQEIQKTFGNRLRIRVCGILIENEKVLMIKHRYIGKNGYLWIPPGGGLDYNESAHEGLKREFKEETGLEISVQKFLFVNEFLSSPLHAIELFFEVKYVAGELQKGSDPEISKEAQMIEEVRFLDIEEIQNENTSNLHQVFRNIAKISFILEKNGYFYSTN
jgi:8-oxo-dGTP diphosphatase